MNKIQFLISCVMGGGISLVLLFTPKITTWQNGLLILRQDKAFLAPLVNWSLVGSHILIILIIGSLLMYWFRDKK
ncbi:MAG: hypothetical protein WDL87_06335 [Candidatus Omnitrophota bacterium]|jgi:hypothetical protein